MSNSPAEPVKTGGAKMESAARTAIFDALADEERRVAVEYLAMETGAVPVDELVGFVEATSVSEVGTLDSRQRTEIRFHHIHLPKMDAAGLIDYDQDGRTVTPTETVDAALSLVDQATDTSDR